MSIFGRLFVAGLFVLVLACGTVPKEQASQVPTEAEPTTSLMKDRAPETAETVAPVKQATDPPLAVTTAPSVPSGTIKAASAVRVRAQPSTDMDNVVGAAQPNETVTLTGRLDDSSWYAVQTAAGVKGWIRADLLTVDPAVPGALPVEPAPVV